MPDVEGLGTFCFFLRPLESLANFQGLQGLGGSGFRAEGFCTEFVQFN